MKVYLLWYKGKYDWMLFGVYNSDVEFAKGKDAYVKSGKCKDGYFDCQIVEINKNLATGYLEQYA